MKIHRRYLAPGELFWLDVPNSSRGRTRLICRCVDLYTFSYIYEDGSRSYCNAFYPIPEVTLLSEEEIIYQKLIGIMPPK